MTLNQLTSFQSLLKEDEHFDIFDIEFDDLKKLTDKQYKYILHLIYSKHYFKAKEILSTVLNHKNKSMTFEEYLSEQFMIENPCVLDDDIPDAECDWVGALDVQEVMDYAQKWHDKEINK